MSAFTGTGTIVRLVIRRDRIKLPAWILAIAAFVAINIPAILDVYGKNAAQQLSYATTSAASVVARVFGGPINGPELGAIVLNETYLFTAILIAFMSTLAIVRHTRQNEETGREEMLSSGILGRHASLTAALLVVIVANLILGVLISLLLLSNDLSATGSWATGASLAAIGIAFAGVAAVTSQISESSRGANSMAAAVIGAAFLLRGAGDAMGSIIKDGTAIHSAWPSWLSPFGWGEQLHPYTELNWLTFVPLILFCIAAIGVAYACNAYRDVGLGLIAAKPGPAHAPKSLSSPFGLALRLQRGLLIGWTVGLAVMGIVVGFIAKEFQALLTENEQVAEIMKALGGGSDLNDVIIGSMMSLMALAMAGYALQALLRMRSEETSGQLEPVLATSVGKWRWMLGHIGCTCSGILILSLALGLASGVSYILISDSAWSELWSILGAAAVHIPAVLVVTGVTALLFGLLPKLAIALSWSFFAVCMLMGQFGAILDLPQALLNLSPFSHTPFVPATSIDWLPIILLTGASVALMLLGLISFRRRDVTTS